MEAKTLKDVIKEMHVDAWNTPAHHKKQYVLREIQSILSSEFNGKFPLPMFYVNALPVCQVTLGVIDQVKALNKLLVEALGLKAVDIKVTVKFGNTTLYLESLEILKTRLIVPGPNVVYERSPQDR